MTLDLSGCRAKIERAHEHGKGLQAEVDFALRPESKLIQIEAKPDRQSGYHVYRVATMPEAWMRRAGLIIGDIVHNLRSALDHLFWQLYCVYHGVPRDEWEATKVQFPIDDKYGTFSMRRKERFGEIPELQWAIIARAQPHEGPDMDTVAIKMIRDLSNRDKHRVLTPVLLRPRQRLISHNKDSAITRARSPLDFSHAAKRLEVGAEVVRVVLPDYADAEMEMAGYAISHIQFPQGELIPVDLDVMYTAHYIIAAVERLVFRIESCG